MAKTKTYVVKRIAIDYYEVATEDGEANALFEVTRPFYERSAEPKRNDTHYEVWEKTDDD